MSNINSDLSRTFLQLCACAVNGKAINIKRFSEDELEELYKFCKLHSLTALACEGLELVGCEKEQILEFLKARDMSVRKNLMLDTERAELFAFFEQSGIWYMSLKGVVLKDLYTKMGLRQMADNDILFDSAYREAVRDWFCSRGYETVMYGEYIHDEYKKPPVYNFEMHTALYDEFYKPKWNKYYKEIKSRLIKDKDNNFGFHFTDEDFYIYFLSHAFKHFERKGIGIRFLLDLYVFLKTKGETLDFGYIKKELALLELLEFEENSRALALEIFQNPEIFDFNKLSEHQQVLLTYFLESGTYGNFSSFEQRQISEKGRFKYFVDKTFPNTDVVKGYHPIFKHKILLPLGWIYRAFSVIFSNPNKIRRTLDEIEKNKNSK